MKASNSAKLARIWADAVPLSSFIVATSRGGAGQAEYGDDTRSSDDRSSRIENVARMVESAAYQLASLKEAKAETMNELIAGRLVCLGRKPYSNEFEKIDPSTWIGADVDWGGNTVTRDDQAIIDVRVMTSRVDEEAGVRDKRGPGRPSQGEVISAAIAKYAVEDPKLNRPLLERYRAYKSYISKCGYDPHKDDGFSDKTIEKYETEYRNKNR